MLVPPQEAKRYFDEYGRTGATAVEIKPPATAESVKPTAIAVAKVAAAKLP